MKISIQAKLTLICALMTLTAACNKNGGGNGGPDIGYNPKIAEPKFEVIKEVEPYSTNKIYQLCLKDAPVDPRLKIGDSYSQITENFDSKSTGKPDFQFEFARTVQEVSPIRVKYGIRLFSSGAQNLNLSGSQEVQCKKAGTDTSWDCSDHKETIDGQPNTPSQKRESSSTDSDKCENHLESIPGDKSYTNTVQLGYATMADGTRVIALRDATEYLMQDKCPNSKKTVKSISVHYYTAAIPSFYPNSYNCLGEIYSRSSTADTSTNKILNYYSSAIVGHPQMERIGNYPGLENIGLLLEEKKVEPVTPPAPGPAPVPAPVPAKPSVPAPAPAKPPVAAPVPAPEEPAQPLTDDGSTNL